MKSGTGPCCQHSPTDHHATLQIKHKLSFSYSSFYSQPEIRRDTDHKVFLEHIFFAIYTAFLCHLHFKLVNFLYVIDELFERKPDFSMSFDTHTTA